MGLFGKLYLDYASNDRTCPHRSRRAARRFAGRRAAEALDCALVYALVPNSSLGETISRRARSVAARDVARAHHTMLLEDQVGARDDQQRLVEELAEQVKGSRELWRD